MGQQPLLQPGEEDDRELQPLDLVEGDQGHPALGARRGCRRPRPGATFSRNWWRPSGGRHVRVLLRVADQLGDVCPALLPLGGAVAEHRLVAGLLDDPLQQPGDGERRAQLAEAGDQGGEAGQRLEGPAAQLRLLASMLDGLEGRDPALPGDPLQLGDAPLADLAPRDVDDPRRRRPGRAGWPPGAGRRGRPSPPCARRSGGRPPAGRGCRGGAGRPRRRGTGRWCGRARRCRRASTPRCRSAARSRAETVSASSCSS